MCGIAGIVHLRDMAPPRVEDARRMAGLLASRGPDASGIYHDNRAALAHTRLSILDPEGGAQPMASPDNRFWIVFNGEIFNYPELRKGLKSIGHRFRTHSDTEVLLLSYVQWGTDCLRRLNGQFAFAVWDSQDKILFAARDRLGILPLHYTVQQDRLIFSSEARAILSLPGVERRIDPAALKQTAMMWAPVPGRSAFAGVQELAPGRWMKASEAGIETQTYWSLLYSEADSDSIPFEAACERTRELLLDSIRIRLRSDVPVGAYLSGGVDSSLITSLTRGHFANSLETFGVQFEDKRYDEADFQERLARDLSVSHRSLRLNNGDIGAGFAEAVWRAEKPMTRTAPVPLMQLARAVRDSGFKVVLTGEGADEVFAGYNIFREAKWREWWNRAPESVKRPLLIARLYPYVFRDPRLHRFLKQHYRTTIDNPEDPFYSHRVRWNNSEKILRFLSPEFAHSVGNLDPVKEIESLLPDRIGHWGLLQRAQWLESNTFMTQYLLSTQGDRMSMSHGVEIRVPYLDHRLVEFVAGLPSHYKLRGLHEKRLLKRAFEHSLPREILDRPKQPYRAPVARAVLHDKAEETREAVSETSIRKAGIFDARRVSSLVKKAQNAGDLSEVDSMSLAFVASTQILHQRFIEEFPGTKTDLPEPFHLISMAHSSGQ